MKIKQILLCMLLACFILPASAQNSWGIVGGGLFSKILEDFYNHFISKQF